MIFIRTQLISFLLSFSMMLQFYPFSHKTAEQLVLKGADFLEQHIDELPCKQWVIRGTVALPDGYSNYQAVEGTCYGFCDGQDYSISARFRIPPGEKTGIFEFSVPAKIFDRYEFFIEVTSDSGLVKSGMNLSKNGQLSGVRDSYYIKGPVTDLGTYTLLKAKNLYATILLPQEYRGSNYMYGFIRATKVDHSFSTQSRFSFDSIIMSLSQATNVSVQVPDDGPYMLSVYLPKLDNSNLCTQELYFKDGGLLSGEDNARTFTPNDHAYITLREFYTVKGKVTLPANTPGDCSVEIFLEGDTGVISGYTIQNIKPGETASYQILLFSPDSTLRLGYRISGNSGLLLSNQAIYTDGLNFSLDRQNVSRVVFTNTLDVISFIPTERIP